MHDIIVYILLAASFFLGLPTGITIERRRLYRAMQKYCPEAIEILHHERKI